MKITFLGTGTSTGNPEIGCRCEVCTSADPCDRRFRASVLVDVEGKRILIDCGPDFRLQMLSREFKKIDGVLLTHEHYDHVGGLDDLRPFVNRFGDVGLYGEAYVLEAIQRRIPYSFEKVRYPGVPSFTLHVVEENEPFDVGGIKVMPVRLMHARLPIFGYRIGNFAYLTDLKYISEREYDKLKDLDVLVIDALRHKEHISHETLAEALGNIKRIAPRNAYLIHMSHHIGLHREIQNTLPENVFLSYDGLTIELK